MVKSISAGDVFKHYLSKELMGKSGRPVSVLLVGAGGNGGRMLSGLAIMDHALRALGKHPGLSVWVMDEDKVGPENVGRQLYSVADIGRSKSVCLSTRMNMAFGTHFKAAPRNFSKDDVEDLAEKKVTLVISCVDNVPARKLLYRAVRGHPMYFLDCGNSKSAGQIILGTGSYIPQPENEGECIGILPTVLDLFPKLGKEEKKSYQGPSCGLRMALEKQDLFVNLAVTTFALQLLWEGLTQGYLTQHGVFVNLKTKRTSPVAINPVVWKQMGWVPYGMAGDAPTTPQSHALRKAA